MNGKASEDPGEDFTSRVGAESPCSDMKRAAAKMLIERYFYQLTDGCGNSQCDNQHCASSGKVTNLTPNQAAAQAIQLFSQEARLCDGTQPNKIPRTASAINNNNNNNNTNSNSNSNNSVINNHNSNSTTTSLTESGPALLAKSMPNKTMNPSSSVEVSCSQSQEILNKLINNLRQNDGGQDLRDDRSEKQKKKLISKNSNCSQCGKKLEDGATGSEDESGSGSEKSGSDSESCSGESEKLISNESFSRILKNCDVKIPVRKRGRPKKEESKGKTKKIERREKRGGDKTGRRNKRIKLDEEGEQMEEGEGELRDPVIELMVLAMYLRYLEAKKYS